MELSNQAFIGAAAGPALVVTVYEGRVLLGNDQGREAAGPGQTVIVSAAGQPPALRPEHAVPGTRPR
jgi:ferric-dicitrate binding protein FerR (iron transport regulator)